MVQVIINKFSSIVVEGNLRINEGDSVSFVVDTGEKVSGILMKICGGKKDRKLQILPDGEQHEEVWALSQVTENTLTVTKTNVQNEEVEE